MSYYNAPPGSHPSDEPWPSVDDEERQEDEMMGKRRRKVIRVPILWECPKHCAIDYAIVCGGELEPGGGNVYFLMDLTGEYSRVLWSGNGSVDSPTDEQWDLLYEHADGGCCSEPQCPECLEYLERR